MLSFTNILVQYSLVITYVLEYYQKPLQLKTYFEETLSFYRHYVIGEDITTKFIFQNTRFFRKYQFP